MLIIARGLDRLDLPGHSTGDEHELQLVLDALDSLRSKPLTVRRIQDSLAQRSIVDRGKRVCATASLAARTPPRAKNHLEELPSLTEWANPDVAFGSAQPARIRRLSRASRCPTTAGESAACDPTTVSMLPLHFERSARRIRRAPEPDAHTAIGTRRRLRSGASQMASQSPKGCAG
jgi:hypothetical protein